MGYGQYFAAPSTIYKPLFFWVLQLRMQQVKSEAAESRVVFPCECVTESGASGFKAGDLFPSMCRVPACVQLCWRTVVFICVPVPLMDVSVSSELYSHRMLFSPAPTFFVPHASMIDQL